MARWVPLHGPMSTTTELYEDTLPVPQSADPNAFMLLVSPHAAHLLRLARRLTCNLEDAEDVCQESLLKAFSRIDQFQPASAKRHSQAVSEDELRAWLMKIVVNCAIDLFRRRRSRKSLSLEESHAAHYIPFEPSASGWGENPEAAYARHESLEALDQAIADLPGKLQTVCLLHDVVELTTKEVAARLGLSTIAVRLRLFRAHNRLRRTLSGVPASDQRRLQRRPQFECAYGD
jgi:RNA polymerase sigma-70 factor, ECF subfamily